MKHTSSQEIFGELLTRLKEDQTIQGFTTHKENHDVFEAEFICKKDPSANPHLMQFALMESDNDAVVMIIAWVGKASLAQHSLALRANASLSYGRIALIEQDNVEKYAVVYYHDLSELSSQELANAAREVILQSEAFRNVLLKQNK